MSDRTNIITNSEKTMAKEDNLKSWKKGQSGNPKGRPKKLPHLEELLADILGEDKEGITAAEAILRALRAKATKGDIRAAEVLLERAYGKAKQGIELTGANSEPIQIIINDKL